MVVKYYYSSVSSNMEIKTKQQKIELVLDSKKIEYEKIDISAGEAVRQEMRDKVGDPKALPPQLFNGDTYCGDFDAFDLAVEDEKINEFLKLC